MAARGQTSFDVRVGKVETIHRQSGVRYRVRWIVGGHRQSRTFTTRALADSRRSELMSAARRGEPFDVESGLPGAEAANAGSGTSWWDWVLRYVDLKWPTLSPNSRRSLVEALIDSTMAMLGPGRGRPSDRDLRSAMWQWAFHTPRRAAGRPPEELAGAVAWLSKNTRPLREISDAAVARSVLQVLATRKDGTPAAATTVVRKRAVLYNVLELAVEQDLLPTNPLDRIKWKPPKVNHVCDPRSAVNPTQARALLAAVGNLADPDDPDRRKRALAARGRRLVAFFGCMYYAALRPSEALALTVDDLDLPDAGDLDGDGWGQLVLSRSNAEVSATWTDTGRREPRQLKHRATGHVRPVPCPPPLVAILRDHLATHGHAPDGRLFVGSHGGHLTTETYNQIWDSARTKALTPAEAASGLAARPYDLRHSAVSTWLASGVDSVQVAEWAGHSIAVLHRVYAHVLPGRSAAARRQIEVVLGLPSKAPSRPERRLPSTR